MTSPFKIYSKQRQVKFENIFEKIPESFDSLLQSDLTGKNVAMSGGMVGLGREIALLLASKGATVRGVSRNINAHAVDPIHLATPPVSPGPGSITIMDCDIRSDASIDAFYNAGPAVIDIVINVASISNIGRLSLMSGDNVEDLFKTNFIGTHRFTTKALPRMTGSDPRVVTVSSLAARVFGFAESTYSISKRAIDWWSVMMDAEEYPTGLTTTTPSFGGVTKAPKFITIAYPDMYGRFGQSSSNFTNHILADGEIPNLDSRGQLTTLNPPTQSSSQPEILTFYSRILALSAIDPSTQTNAAAITYENAAKIMLHVLSIPTPAKEYGYWIDSFKFPPNNTTFNQAFEIVATKPIRSGINLLRTVQQAITNQVKTLLSP